jgi:hypothetical protein
VTRMNTCLLVAFLVAAAGLGGCSKSSPTEPPPPPNGARNETEPNDFSPQALGALSATDFVVSGSMSSGSDVDLYTVTSSGPFALLANLDWSTASDLELTISNANGIFVRHVDGVGHPESCTLIGLPAGAYTVRVGSLSASATPYSLTLGMR